MQAVQAWHLVLPWNPVPSEKRPAPPAYKLSEMPVAAPEIPEEERHTHGISIEGILGRKRVVEHSFNMCMESQIFFGLRIVSCGLVNTTS